MRKGYTPRVVWGSDNKIVALATGSDACTEHELGIQKLMQRLGASSADAAADARLIQALRSGQPVQYPDFMQRLCIAQPEALRLDLLNDEAVLWSDPAAHTARNGVQRMLDSSEFRYVGIRRVDDELDSNIAAMWDEESMAIRVRTPRYVQALQELYQAALDGELMFGGSFFEVDDLPLRGIILVHRGRLQASHLQAQQRAQAKFEQKLRLQALSRLPQLEQQLRALLGASAYWRYFSHVWAEWADSRDESQGVAYRVNPGTDGRLAGLLYGKGYSFEELVEFAQSRAPKTDKATA